MSVDTMVGHTTSDPPPARRPFSTYFPSEVLVRVVQHFHAYGQLREEGRALTKRLLATGVVYDLPAAKSIEQRLGAWADAADALLADADAGGEVADLRPWTADLRDTLRDVRLVLQMPVERAAAVKERIAREGFTGGITMDDLLRERVHHRPGT